MLWIVAPAEVTGDFLSDTERSFSREDRINSAFLSEQAAIAAAEQKAAAHPTKQFAVLGVVVVCETTTPKIIRKKLDDRGQLVVSDNV